MQNMTIKKFRICDLNRSTYNPRKELQPGDEKYEAIKSSLLAYGNVEPVIVNQRGNVVISGHQRLKILEEIGQTEVVASVVDFSEDAEKQLSLALNKIEGEWDKEKLDELLSEIGGEQFTGFSQADIEELRTEMQYMQDGQLYAEMVENIERYYNVRLLFDEDEYRSVNGYIREYGKQPLADIIPQVARRWKHGS